MNTKEKLKAAIDKVPDEYLEILYRILQAFEIPAGELTTPQREDVFQTEKRSDFDWQQFVKETYGCLAEAPIQRGDQGKFEIREAME